MSKSTKKSDPHASGREYTAHLLERLQNRPQPGGAEANAKAKTASKAHQAKIAKPGSMPSVPNSLRRFEGYMERPGTRLAQLLAQVNRLAQLNAIFHAYLPPHLNDHANLIKLSSEEWIVQTDSPAWATRLRYCLPNLHRQLEEQLGEPIPPLRIRIVPPAVTPSPLPPRRMKLSDQAANLLEGAARNLDDQDLSAALMRLAKHGRKCG